VCDILIDFNWHWEWVGRTGHSMARHGTDRGEGCFFGFLSSLVMQDMNDLAFWLLVCSLLSGVRTRVSFGGILTALILVMDVCISFVDTFS